MLLPGVFDRNVTIVTTNIANIENVIRFIISDFHFHKDNFGSDVSNVMKGF